MMRTPTFRSLADARRDPEAALIIEDQSECITFLTCPVARVGASEAALERLMLDLLAIRYHGFGADLDPCDMVVRYGPKSSVRGAPATDAVWLAPCLGRLPDLREQVETVIGGGAPRLDFPEGWPFAEVDSLERLRHFPKARVIFYSGPRNRDLLNCRASLVTITQEQMERLLRSLESLLRTPLRSAAVPHNPPASRVLLLPYGRGTSVEERDLDLFEPLENRGLRQAILGALTGGSSDLLPDPPEPQC